MQPLNDLNNMFFFAAVVDAAGFSAAARDLGLQASKLSRRISTLEQELGVRLLNRNSRSISLTEAGRAFYAHCRVVLAEVQAARDTINQAWNTQGIGAAELPDRIAPQRSFCVSRAVPRQEPRRRRCCRCDQPQGRCHGGGLRHLAARQATTPRGLRPRDEDLGDVSLPWSRQQSIARTQVQILNVTRAAARSKAISVSSPSQRSRKCPTSAAPTALRGSAGILDAMRLSEALVKALAGDAAALDSYGIERRPVAQQVVALADRLTRLATVRPGLRALRNMLLSTLSGLPLFRRNLAWRQSGLVYR